MMNLHNHALSAALQNGCYTYITPVCVWFSLIGRVVLITMQVLYNAVHHYFPINFVRL